MIDLEYLEQRGMIRREQDRLRCGIIYGLVIAVVILIASNIYSAYKINQISSQATLYKAKVDSIEKEQRRRTSAITVVEAALL